VAAEKGKIARFHLEERKKRKSLINFHFVLSILKGVGREGRGREWSLILG